MRIWSVHPKYLDPKGLVALWREALLAKNVLMGNIRGYTKHPQLTRFKNTPDPVQSIDSYLVHIYSEALERAYRFDKSKVNFDCSQTLIPVTRKQLMFEFDHLLKKLEIRNIAWFKKVSTVVEPKTHPIFELVDGEIENWEISAGI